MAIKRALRTVAQPTKQAGDAWSYGTLLWPFAPAPLFGVAIGWARTSPVTGVWVLAVGLLATMLALSVIGAWKLASEVEAHESAPRPYLSVVGPKLRQNVPLETIVSNIGSGVIPGGASQVVRIESTTFLGVMVANDPPSGQRGEDARSVAALLTFFDSATGASLVGPIDGRWAKSDAVHVKGRYHYDLNKEIDLPSNGRPQYLDVVFKYPGESSCYAYNDSNAGTSDARLREHELPVERVRVEVQLRAANSDLLTATFLLENSRDELAMSRLP